MIKVAKRRKIKKSIYHHHERNEKSRSKITIATTPKEVISAFTDRERLADWWQVEKTLIEKKINGVYVLTWGITQKGIGYVSSGTIEDYDEHEKLEIKNFVYLNPQRPFLGPMGLTIHATQKGSLTELYLCQDGYQKGPDWDWNYYAVKEAWPKVLQTLKSYIVLG